MSKRIAQLIKDLDLIKRAIFIVLMVAFLFPFFIRLNALTSTGSPNLHQRVFRVSIGEEEIGTVASEEYVTEFLSYAEGDYGWLRPGSDAENSIRFTETRSRENIFLQHALFKKRLINYLSTHQEAYVIAVNGKSHVAVGSVAEAEEILSSIRVLFTPRANGTDRLSDLEVKIRDDVKIIASSTPRGEILSSEEAKKFLIKGTMEEKPYTVKKGDTVWSISRRYNVSTSDIARANPSLNIDHIYIGDTLSLVVPKPFVHVETRFRHTTIERLPYNTYVNWDSSLLRTSRIVEREGKFGSKEITADVTLLNGMQQHKQIIHERIIENPLTQIVRRGTQRTANDKLAAAILPEGIGILTSDYGIRRRGFHTGIDYGVPVGTPIHAYRDGLVSFSGYKQRSGNMVVLIHSGGIVTHYLHCSKLLAKQGDVVSKGQAIALSGNTGYSTGPHVHFEIHENGRLIDPLVLLRNDRSPGEQ